MIVHRDDGSIEVDGTIVLRDPPRGEVALAIAQRADRLIALGEASELRAAIRQALRENQLFSRVYHGG
jgi:hypothetical protein